MPDHIDLSILVCSVHTRRHTFLPAILDRLYGQLEELPAEDQERVEIVALVDNKQMMLGDKRNVMVDMAQGRYVAFVDDDDRVADDYVAALLEATARDRDVIVFQAEVTLNGGEPKICRYSKTYGRDRNTSTEYLRIPNHICCVKTELARKVSFPSILKGEDAGYSKLLVKHLRSEHNIGRVLYYYDYSDTTTEAQTKVNLIPRRRDQPPIVDVVVLSKAVDQRLRRMTQNTVTSCIAGANSLPVNVIVVEGTQATYDGATMIHRNDEFHYNRFANDAIHTSDAPWVMVANNDLEFTNGWLHALLAASHPVVSPRYPADPRQRNVTENETGYENGRHFSGWCFMMQRDIWKRIDGLDEMVTFWCSDDVVVEQLRLHAIPPMLVVDSVVNHLGSSTLKRLPAKVRDDLTWGQIHAFNERFGQSKFADDPRYRAWQRRHARA